jgi:drug/metabolite transporter (DMT)-like permease
MSNENVLCILILLALVLSVAVWAKESLLLLIVIIVGYIVFRRSYPREPLPRPGPARISYLKGTFCFVVAIIFSVIAFLLFSFRDLLAQRYSMVPGYADYALLLFLGAACTYRARQYRANARLLNLPHQMSGPFVLYLRSSSRTQTYSGMLC